MPVYAAIDLKSFYASAECAARQLDPLSTNLVVADASRTDKTICLAVSPSLKALGVPGRPRLFEVKQRVDEINARRLTRAPGGKFAMTSFDARALEDDPSLKLGFITAVPRMSLYMQTSTRVLGIYLRHIAPEDIHVYSVDECFLDLTHYLGHSHMSAHELTAAMIREVLYETGITATGGIGTNLYLCKVAMDIVAKHIPADADGVRIAELDEASYRRLLWDHTPLTDFWRVGSATARRLNAMGLNTMGDIALCSVNNDDLLYRTFGKNAELLIDHAWGWEPVTIADIRAYRPAENSLSSGQVLSCAYDFDRARLVIREMADALSYDLVRKGLVTDQLVITVGYDTANYNYTGPAVRDHYGRTKPRHAHGSVNLPRHSASSRLLVSSALHLFDEITDHSLLIRRLNIAACHVLGEHSPDIETPWEQLNLFTDPAADLTDRREHRLQQAVVDIRSRFGKNAILKGTSFLPGATAAERNRQIGGHRA